ncbi:hypothetical protein QAD02_014198 [Eretmocerus hayati]|uniref:Uncharacterized protein n=1 Tax=Eretmocerus hayati TaxID=131215 RepID=A0ACC2P4P2_9HYME|nr:hypothetical protein QAD02_014198 [Eretmocerus hayati]
MSFPSLHHAVPYIKHVLDSVPLLTNIIISGPTILINTTNIEQPVLESESADDSNSFNLYVCNYCTEIFLAKNTLEAHQMAHQEIRTNYCDSCKTQFKSYYELRYHNCIKKFVCNICGDTLSSLQRGKKHELEHHHNDHGHLCKICGRKFQNKHNMDQHYKSEHTQAVKEFSCSKCPRKFKFKTRLDHHLRSSHSINFFICQDCDIDFKNAVGLKKHNIHQHSGINAKVECLECKARVPVHGLRKHVDTHSAQKKNVPVVCQSCNQSFGTEVLLENHRKKSHIQCASCPSVFSSTFTYKNHQLKVHNNEGKCYACPHCPKEFITESKRKRHLVTHSSSTPFKCSHCEFQSKFQDNLNQHILINHCTERPLKCDKCSWTFRRTCDLNRHQTTHSKKEVHFYCKFCHKKFEYAGNKTKHERKCHKSG